MFGLLVYALPALTALSSLPKFASAIGSLVLTAAVYTTFLKAILWLFTKSLRLRKILLGPSFLEGIWIGHYTVQGVRRYTVEFFDQSDGSTRIQGREFDDQFKLRANWQSDTVAVDVTSKVITYAYTCSVFEQKYSQQGIGHFQIISEERNGRPTKLDGYAVDVTDGQRDPNTEKKISDVRLGDEEIFKQARKVFG
ncbi:hypothetical protein [Alteriqipengyuania lutimaris]|uniref:hypothetical protein n=1 Tax=Alteriqipengyuania lutimaris TaxID=1538146 RepID=UPI001CFD7801|nr:hypothetical protein [Alteriqipengyuania lutimaris]